MSLSQTDRESLLTWLTDGNTLADWIRGPGSHMARCTVYAKVARDPELTEAFKISRQVGADAIADKIQDDMYAEPERVTDQLGVTRIDSAYVALLKARAEIMLKLLAKWNSGKYGEKVTTTLTGPDGGPVAHSLDVRFVG